MPLRKCHAVIGEIHVIERYIIYAQQRYLQEENAWRSIPTHGPTIQSQDDQLADCCWVEPDHKRSDIL